MRKIAIIGSGVAGCLTAHGLRKAGHEVTLYSDRSPEDWLTKSAPTGTAARFPSSLDFDVELGLNHWDDVCPRLDGVSLAFGVKRSNRLVTMTSRLDRPGRAIDVRLVSARWMKDLEERGGKVVIEAVTVARLDEIAAQNDLTIVAAGSKDLCRLFPRNAERSVHEGPQRKLCLVIARGAPMQLERVPHVAVRFNLNAEDGEQFMVPFLHKDGDAVWNILIEAKAGGVLDRFDDAKDGHEALAIVKKLVAETAPWDAAWVDKLTLCDERSWLKGAITPTVRSPVGKLPSGRVVTAVGDTVIHMDPIAGQGANCGTRLSRHIVRAVAARADGAFDEAWMTQTFESFWEAEGKHIVRFNNLLLEPISSAGKIVLISQYGSDGVSDTVQQRLANAFTANFDDTTRYTDALVDAVAAKKMLSEAGGTFPWTLLKALTGVAAGQFKQAVGIKPAHPAQG